MWLECHHIIPVTAYICIIWFLIPKQEKKNLPGNFDSTKLSHMLVSLIMHAQRTGYMYLESIQKC